MTRPRSFHAALLLSFVPLLALATALAWWAATSVLSEALEDDLEARMAQAAEVLASGAVPLTPALLARTGELLGAELALLDDAGRLGPSTLDPGQAPLGQAIERAWRESGAGPATLELGAARYRLLVRASSTGGDPRYPAVAALVSLDKLGAATRRSALWLGVAALLGTLVLAWVAHRVAASVTRPVRQLAHMAERIAAGDRTARSSIDSPRELEQLAAALNAMAARLQGYEDEVAERNRLAALGELAARVAHEIRNPLTAIKLQLQLLDERADEPGRATSRALLDEIRRLELIIGTTLAMGRGQRPQANAADFNRLIDEVLDLFGPQLAHQGIAVHRDLGELPAVAVDGDRLKQVLINLLTNAAEQLPRGGSIAVTSRVDSNGGIRLAVEDSGPGIDPAARDALFDKPRPASGAGLGVGLALSREIVESHGGRIEAGASAALGGARFTITLPLTIMPAA